jgi:hypothetical protein
MFALLFTGLSIQTDAPDLNIGGDQSRTCDIILHQEKLKAGAL